MKAKFMELINKEDGYGTVEMLLIIAGLGFITTAIFKSLSGTLVEGNSGGDGTTTAVEGVGESITNIISKWSEFGEDAAGNP